MLPEGKSIPCRLFFLLAQNADIGVILRRGPSKWVQVIRWDTARDVFEPGQWFHGRIYEHQTDLSPDGKYMVYFAQKQNRSTYREDYKHNWTAISRPPYLTALALWPLGFFTAGGGVFETERRLWLSHPSFAMAPHPDHLPVGLDSVVPLDGMGNNESVLFQRLERDGWINIHKERGGRTGVEASAYQLGVFEKPGPDKTYVLQMTEAFTGSGYGFLFVVRHKHGQIGLDGVVWAEWDRSGRLVFARSGKIWTGSIDKSGHWHEAELADFNAAQPEQLKAPTWATRW